jgi:hypothetical protein
MAIVKHDAVEFIDKTIAPALGAIAADSENARHLLLGTCAVESDFCAHDRQINGVALGVYQIEPRTLFDIYNNYLAYRPELKFDIHDACDLPQKCIDPEWLVTNKVYATMIARVHYMRVPTALPDYMDVEAMGKYWKQHYNTPLGRGTVDKFVEKYRLYIDENA